jgi:hypothetical protein
LILPTFGPRDTGRRVEGLRTKDLACRHDTV